MRYILLTLLLTCGIASAEVYKTTNPDGSTSYSDTPSEGAEAITPPELTPTPAVKYPKKKPVEAKNDKEKAVPYKSFNISSPSNDAIIRDNNGNISITLSLEPGLQTNFKHSINILLDGKIYKSGITSLSFNFKNIDRGMHQISATVVDSKNKMLKSAPSVIIHLKRHSKLHGKTPTLWPELDTNTTQPTQSAL